MSYVELKSCTHYSFLRGASHPHELIDQAVKCGLPALAVTDLHGVYGLPKAFLAAKEHPKFKLISGAQVRVELASGQRSHFLTVLARTRAGYGLLCRILTRAHADKPKGEASIPWSEMIQLLEHKASQELVVLPDLSGDWNYDDLKSLFHDRVYLPVSRFFDSHDASRMQLAHELHKKYGIERVATNDVHYHIQNRGKLQDVVTAIREGRTLEKAGYLLFPNHERYLKTPQQMRKLFADLPSAVDNTLKIAEQCSFSLSELKYRYPSEWIPQGETAQSYLERLTWEGARHRYSDQIPASVTAQIQHELQLISQLEFSNYFLTIWEIVEFARARKILCQGRGSAANSIVCYVLGITAIDPVRMDLLFERFISVERGEPPDIDIDFEHERREEVIQHIYEKYGRDRAAMVAAVVTYRSRSAIREVTKVFGHETDKRTFIKSTEEHPTTSPTMEMQLIDELKGFPRHLSIHSGGFTLSADPMIEIVPVEPARMENRTIVQWDKYDLDALGLLKVDLLSLGMLTSIRKTMDMIHDFNDSSKVLTLATIPPEDAATYEMMCRSDTIGTFQIESRAQMSMLPRLLPRTFYDLVVEVALVRPGPIVGKMVHPYLRRRKGLEPVSLPDVRLEPILGRTLGVPIFQEQVMKMAVILAGFTPGEADQLRRAIGAWRATGSIDKMGKRLMAGMLEQGIPKEFADQIFERIQGFSEYGFPESHAASFALITYASAYLKCHYPAQFTCGLLNSQPLGFYAPHSLVDDAKRHGVKIYPIHPEISEWDCRIERVGTQVGIRIGFRYLRGVSEKEIELLLKERKQKPFLNLHDFIERCHFRKNILYSLALGDGFACFGFEQRPALWAILAHVLWVDRRIPMQLSLFSASNAEPDAAHPVPFEGMSPRRSEVALRTMTFFDSVQSDYRSFGLSARGHPMQALRAQYPNFPKLTTAQARRMPNGKRIEIFGLSIVVQRPPTAKGTVFATLEDEGGFLDLILHARTYEKFKDSILDHSFLWVTGTVQRDGHSVSLIVQKVRGIDG